MREGGKHLISVEFFAIRGLQNLFNVGLLWMPWGSGRKTLDIGRILRLLLSIISPEAKASLEWE
jgi:hypothetical protein